MHDAALMRGLERVADLPRDGDGLVDWNRAAGQPLSQFGTRHEPHHQPTGLIGQAVNLSDVWIVEPRERRSFPFEA